MRRQLYFLICLKMKVAWGHTALTVPIRAVNLQPWPTVCSCTLAELRLSAFRCVGCTSHPCGWTNLKHFSLFIPLCILWSLMLWCAEHFLIWDWAPVIRQALKFYLFLLTLFCCTAAVSCEARITFTLRVTPSVSLHPCHSICVTPSTSFKRTKPFAPFLCPMTYF